MMYACEVINLCERGTDVVYIIFDDSQAHM